MSDERNLKDFPNRPEVTNESKTPEVDKGPPSSGKFLKRLNEYKEFIAIVVASIAGILFALHYFVAQSIFAKEMIANQCQLMANISKLNLTINGNQYGYMTDRLFAEMYPLRVKQSLTLEESRNLKKMQDTLDALKKRTEESETSARLYEDALNTGNCSKLITYSR